MSDRPTSRRQKARRTSSTSRQSDEFMWFSILATIALVLLLAHYRTDIQRWQHDLRDRKDQALSRVTGGDRRIGSWTIPNRGDSSTTLATLKVVPEHADTAYRRAAFKHWTDPKGVEWGGNGCDTRDDVLAHDLTDVAKRAGSSCIVESGVLDDPYTGKRIDWQRGQTTSTAVQIDHVVPLEDAWLSGADGWTDTRREQFANDPRNLEAVDGPTNESKGSQDPGTWLPPAKGYDCTYVERWVAVKAAYGLTVDAREYAALSKTLTAAC